jgi:uncharacterized protein (TIGR02145 family)
MKSLILVSILILNVLNAFSATEPEIKIYMTDGSSKQYNINDITDLSFFRTNLSYSMSVFQSIGNSKSDFDIRTIDSIEFENNQIMKIVQSGNTKSFNISEIDSIIFTFNTCTEIQIGDQIWMCKNLDVDTYLNGDPIPEVTDKTAWANLTTGAWCYYNNSDSLGKIYGKLYNWYAVNDSRGLAPDGYHIPSDAEWKELEMCLGMSKTEAEKIGWRGTDEGGKLKEAGIVHWVSSNEGATNSSGFSGLPGGYRSNNGNCCDIRSHGAWWSASEYSTTYAWYSDLHYYDTQIYNGINNLAVGYSVRCIKDK